MGISKFELPEEILVDILSRLPVKVLLRLKCVCKLWKSLISSPNFFLSATGRERAILLCFDERQARKLLESLCFYSVDDDLSVMKLPKPIGDFPSSYSDFKFVGTCNGLIIFYAYGGMYLWNPLTRYCRELFLINELINVFHPRILGGIGSGVCFDKSSNDYKIVLVNTSPAQLHGNVDLGKLVYVASLRKGKIWRDISFPYRMPYPDCYSATSTSGVIVSKHLHWLVKKEIGDAQLIVYFDEEMNQFKELPMPDEPDFGDGRYSYYFGLTALNGCLCMSRVLRDNYGYTWPDDGDNDLLLMREYGVKHSWMELCAIRGLLVPLHTRISSNIVSVSSHPYMCTYNIERRYLRRIDIGEPVLGEDSPLERTCDLGNIDDDNFELVQPTICAGPLMYVESLTSVDSI